MPRMPWMNATAVALVACMTVTCCHAYISDRRHSVPWTQMAPGNDPMLPKWNATWNMPLSTAFMPCNDSGYMDPQVTGQWGLADFDWSNAKELWANTKPMDCEERLVAQVQMVRKVNPNMKTFVYRNLVKALPWYSEVREKLTDPAYSGWFLKFKDGVNGTYHQPPCTMNKCSEFYHDQDQTPEYPHGDGSCHDPCDCGPIPCGEYLWDHRNASLRSWLVDTFVMNNETGVGNPLVDGVYLDDGWSNKPDTPAPWWPKEGFCSADKYGGPTEEYPNCTVDMGLGQQDVQAIYDGWQQTISNVHTALVNAGGFAWQLFHQAGGPDKDSCDQFFQQECGDSPSLYNQAWMMTFASKSPTNSTGLVEDLASFLLARGPYAWLGYSWIGCTSSSKPPSGPDSMYPRPSLLDVDYGEPTERCHAVDGKKGVYTRDWSMATVTMDCNTFTGSVVLK